MFSIQPPQCAINMFTKPTQWPPMALSKWTYLSLKEVLLSGKPC